MSAAKVGLGALALAGMIAAGASVAAPKLTGRSWSVMAKPARLTRSLLLKRSTRTPASALCTVAPASGTPLPS